MTDLEHALGPRLHDLADYITEPAATVPATAAIARYRRQRRTRAGLAAVAAAVALIAVGVPTAMTTLGAGRPTGGTADHGPAAPSPHWSYGTESARPEPSLDAGAQAQASEAERQSRLVQLQAMSQLLGAAPVTLTAPAQWGSCPDAEPALSSSLHSDVAYWRGSLPGGPDGCQYTAGVAANSLPQDRLAMGIGFLTGTTTAQLRAGIASSEDAADSRCLHVDTPIAPFAELQQCRLPGETRYYLDIPDTGGAGVWVLSATVGDRYPGDGAEALAAVTAAAVQSYGG